MGKFAAAYWRMRHQRPQLSVRFTSASRKISVKLFFFLQSASFYKRDNKLYQQQNQTGRCAFVIVKVFFLFFFLCKTAQVCFQREERSCLYLTDF